MKNELDPLDPSFGEILPLSIDETKFQELLHAGVIVDARAGGVILGHDEPIYTIFKFGSDYLIQCFTRGGAFVLNKQASTANYGRLRAITGGIAKPPPDDGKSPMSRFICAVGTPDHKLVWVDWCQTIIPPQMAKGFFVELEAMNNAVNPMVDCDLISFFPEETAHLR